MEVFGVRPYPDPAMDDGVRIRRYWTREGCHYRRRDDNGDTEKWVGESWIYWFGSVGCGHVGGGELFGPMWLFPTELVDL